LEELSSFPWFSRWSAEEVESGRPLKRPFIKDFHDANREDGRKGFPWPSVSLDQGMSVPVINSPIIKSSDSSGSSSVSSDYSTYSDESDDCEYEEAPPSQPEGGSSL
jgi:hypothetical protein